MPITVQKRTVPTVALVGKLVNTTTGTYAGSSSTTTINASTNDIVTSSDGLTVTKQTPLVFYDYVTITVTEPYGTYTYNASADTGLVGSALVDGTTVGQNCEVYGTINGKDPIRTKKHLWIGRTRTVRYNTSGSDNVVLKAKTYYRGEESDVITINFRVVRPDESVVNNA